MVCGDVVAFCLFVCLLNCSFLLHCVRILKLSSSLHGLLPINFRFHRNHSCARDKGGRPCVKPEKATQLSRLFWISWSCNPWAGTFYIQGEYWGLTFYKKTNCYSYANLTHFPSNNMVFYTWLMFKWKHDFTWPHVNKKLSSHIHCLRTFLMHIHNLCSYANRSSSHPGSWSVYCEMFCCDCSPRL